MPDEHKGAIPVVHIEAVKLFYARNNNILVSFFIIKLACKWSCKIIVKATFMKNNHFVLISFF